MLVFEKACHLPVKLKHQTFWATEQLNFYLDKADDIRKLQIFKVEKLRNKAYENAKITKIGLRSFTINISLENFCSQIKSLTL